MARFIVPILPSHHRQRQGEHQVVVRAFVPGAEDFVGQHRQPPLTGPATMQVTYATRIHCPHTFLPLRGREVGETLATPRKNYQVYLTNNQVCITMVSSQHDIYTRELDMNGQDKRHAGELFAVIGLYAVVLIVALRLLHFYPHSAFRTSIALAPMLPALLLPVVVVRRLRRMDELQRQQQLEALGFAFAGTAVLTFGYGFLETVGFPAISSFAVWPLMAVLWVIGGWIAQRSYR